MGGTRAVGMGEMGWPRRNKVGAARLTVALWQKHHSGVVQPARLFASPARHDYG